jgi:hypothetical protein
VVERIRTSTGNTVHRQRHRKVLASQPPAAAWRR